MKNKREKRKFRLTYRAVSVEKKLLGVLNLSSWAAERAGAKVRLRPCHPGRTQKHLFLSEGPQDFFGLWAPGTIPKITCRRFSPG
jgi:hypothetical protein